MLKIYNFIVNFFIKKGFSSIQMKITLNSPSIDFESKGASLSYTLANSLYGSAAGMIYVKYTAYSAYHICWADDRCLPLTVKSKDKLLKYSPLCTFEGDNSKEFTYKVLDFTAIPQGAKRLVLTNGDGTVLTSVALPEYKLLPL